MSVARTPPRLYPRRFHRWVSGLKDVLDETPPGSDTRRIRFSAGTMGLSVSYTLEYTLESPTRLSWVSVAGWVHTVHD